MFQSWREFKRNKIKKQDVLQFSFNLEANIFQLHSDLADGLYAHGAYQSFLVCDPKLRSIHKASVRDRLLHHAIVRVIGLIFEKSFISDSYSSRKGKGVHRAGARFRQMAHKLSQNKTKTVWVLKCDIKKFFDSVDHAILLRLLKKQINDQRVLALLENMVYSFQHDRGRGIPLGNLTSQLFSNVYLDPLDQFVRHTLNFSRYVRYADDFVLVSCEEQKLRELIPHIENFLGTNLKLSLHDHKVILKKWHQGVDFLGYVHFPTHAIVRPRTRRRILSRVNSNNLSSYLGIASHCAGYKLEQEIFKKLNGKI